jgi:taurine dioxygenase
MALQIRRIAYALGAEVTGVDLRQPLEDTTIATIRTAWLDHLLLLFPNQDLTKDELLAFARRFGELELVGQPDPKTPYITLVTEKPINGKPWNGVKGGQVWHTDKDFTTHPTVATFLNGKEIPDAGGDTMFANTYMAYEALSPAMKSVVERLSVIHDYALGVRSQPAPSDKRTPEQIRRAVAEKLTTLRGLSAEKLAPADRGGRPAPVVHPAVRIHPETNRKALYLGERARQVVGMTDDESRALLDFLKEHTVKYEFTYRHRWTVNDLIMWDNRSTLHIALSDYDLQRDPRLMFRCAVTGPESGYSYSADDGAHDAAASAVR